MIILTYWVELKIVKTIMSSNNKFLFACLVMIAFYTCIGIAIYVTESAWPLFGVILCPSFEINYKDK